jgi:EAL domain-containing protein (putative c-di-GMP-specific phosphodiesterase class I)
MLAPDTQDAAIVKTIIALGRNLRLSVIAEGVETQAQLDFLSEAGCDAVQGYHIGKPMCAADLSARLRGQA